MYISNFIRLITLILLSNCQLYFAPIRRGSTFGRISGAGLNLMSVTHHLPFKDPRPIRDKQWQYAAIRNLIHFLLSSGYDRPISPKILTSPTTKDFQLIFKFLYNKLDEGYDWTTGKKFEDDVVTLLRGLKYPFIDGISRNALYSVGSMHTWPTLLAALVWMVELILATDQVKQDMDLEQLNDKNPERIFFEFVCRAYGEYLMGNEDFDAMQEDLAVLFQKKDEALINDINELENENAQLQDELSKLQDEPTPLQVATKQKTSLLSDLEKIKKWSDTLNAKHAQLSDQIAKLKQEEHSRQIELDVIHKEKDELQDIVDNQEISPADVDRMNAERDQLTKTIDQLNDKNSEFEKNIWEKEISVQKKVDEVEKLTHDFNNKAYRLHLVPISAKNANGKNFDLQLNNHATRADQMVNIDLRGEIKSALLDLRSHLKNEIMQAQDQCIAIRESFDRLSESVNEKLDEVQQIDSRIKRCAEQCEIHREEAQAETRMKTEEMEKLDRELRRAKVDSTKSLFDAQKQAREIKIDYDNLVRRTNEQKEKVVKEMILALEQLIDFKQRITDQLSDLDAFALDALNNQRSLMGDLLDNGQNTASDIIEERFLRNSGDLYPGSSIMEAQ